MSPKRKQVNKIDDKGIIESLYKCIVVEHKYDVGR